MTTNMSRRSALGLAAGAASLAFGASPVLAAQTIRIGLPTKTWWPTVLAETAVAQGLFRKAGLDPDLTIYRSGGEAFEALAAGASDFTIGLVSQQGTGRRRGIMTKIVALGVQANTGWKLLVRPSSPVKTVADLAGKKVGITAAGSLSDLMALWTRSTAKIDFTSVPLGGGGLVPNLLSGNVDAAVVYSPLSFQMLQGNQAREILDYAKAIPPHLASGWATTDKIIAERKDLLRSTLQAMFGAVAYMHANRDAAIKIIAEANNVAVPIATQEYEETFLKLSKDGRFTLDQTRAAMELARIGGFDNMAPAEEFTTMDFTPVALSA